MFEGCEILQDERTKIQLSMIRYSEGLKQVPISRTRRKEQNESCTEIEVKAYRTLAGTLIYLGNGTLPQASFVTSIMQKRQPRLIVIDLVDVNAMVQKVLQLSLTIYFPAVTDATFVEYPTFSDASHLTARDYGQTEHFSGLLIYFANAQPHHFMSSIGAARRRKKSAIQHMAQILAASTGDDRRFYFKQALNLFFPKRMMTQQLIVDREALFDPITTLHNVVEYRLRPTVQCIRNSFESHELDIVRWIPGICNSADALTKRNIVLYKSLHHVCFSGTLNAHLDNGYSVKRKEWV